MFAKFMRHVLAGLACTGGLAPCAATAGERLPLLMAQAASPETGGKPAALPQQGDALERSLRNHRIRLAADGSLAGVIHLLDPDTGEAAPLTDLSLAFLQNGEAKAVVRPNDEGVFRAEGLTPGVYSLVGSGPDGYIAFGLQVMPHERGKPPRENVEFRPPQQEAPSTHFVVFQEVADELQIHSLAVPRRDLATVVRLMRSYVPAEVLKAPPGELPASARPEERKEEPQPPADETAPPSTVFQRHAVQIRDDGSLSGRTRRIHPQTGRPTRMRRLNVFLVRDNQIVGQAPVTEAGTFTFRSVSPGLYSFVAAGLEGFAAFSVQAVSPDQKMSGAAGELSVPVAFFDDGPLEMDTPLVLPEDLPYVWARLREIVGQEFAEVRGGALLPNGQQGPPSTPNGPATGISGVASGGGGVGGGNNIGSPSGSPGGGGGGGTGGGGGGGGPANFVDEVPEIDPRSAGTALALLIGSVLLLTDLRRRAVHD